ncbi:MAG: hypothetical protein JF593_04960 [Novosphingobium sp.]|nr:hypothetical protein [Novosphingobium sp.]
MKHLLALLAPLALLPCVAVLGTSDAAPALANAQLTARASPASVSSGPAVLQSFRSPVQHQVRMEQRLIIRISPRGHDLPPPPPFFDMQQPIDPPRLVERKMGRCVSIAGIAGVQVDRDKRLLLFMRDQRIVSAALEKACHARDYYSGFYIARNADGLLCVDRDKLQSRSGANCALTKLRQLVDNGY